MNVYIFDLDGTLANIEHRLHHIKGEKKDWDAFFAACVKDEPIRQTIDVLNALAIADGWIIISSGRSDIVRKETLDWLRVNGVDYDHLIMRKHGDHRPDEVIKEEWLTQNFFGPRENIVAVFDDRKRVVDMWRRNGLVCYQVAEGEF